MAAFFVSTVTIRNKEKFRQYAEQAAATLAGNAEHQAVGIVRFPDQAALKAWYDSEGYRALIPLRDEAAEMTLVAYSEPS